MYPTAGVPASLPACRRARSPTPPPGRGKIFTILGSTNKGRFSATVGEDQRVSIDPALLEQVATTVRQLNICGLVCVGGDGSLAIAQQF